MTEDKASRTGGWRRLAAPDRTVIRALAGRAPKTVSAAMSRVTQRAGLWWAGTAWLALTGRRRAAARGLLAVGLAGAVANGPVKWATDRRRPQPRDTGGHRPYGPEATTASFPSGHTAEAVAFAVAVWSGRRLSVRTVLGSAAALTGASRVATLRHWPSDIVAGAVIGLAAGGAARGLVAARPPAKEGSPR